MGTEGPIDMPLRMEGSFPKTFTVHFDGSHFGSLERPTDTYGVVGGLNKWWDDLCTQEGFNPDDKRFGKIIYFIIELGKNALEYGESGEVKVIFNPNEITAIVTDSGPGFEDPNDNIEAFPHHGLSSLKQYADKFTIETNGRKFIKIPKKRKLVISEETTDVQRGARITFSKRLKIA